MKFFKKNIFDIKNIDISSKLTSNILDYINPYVILGISTNQIDKLCYKYIYKFLKAFPATLNYFLSGYTKYPKSTCISINNIVCHGIPNEIKLKFGDVVNVDIALIKNGYFSDSSRMFSICIISNIAKNLLKISYICLWKAIKIIRPGLYSNYIGNTIYNYIKLHKFSVVKEYCGHSTGLFFHENFNIVHYKNMNNSLIFKKGMIFTIEPIINIGKRYVKNYLNNWTIKTIDNSLSSQWEHTILVTKDKYKVLTI